MGRVSGFRMVSQDEEADIDAKLEDYFLNNRSKFEEQHEEYKTYAGGNESGERRDQGKEEDKVDKEIKSIEKAVEKKTGTAKEVGVGVPKSPAKEIELRTKTPTKSSEKIPEKPKGKGQKKSANSSSKKEKEELGTG